jgi:Holliday junction resolvase RusA-like endonuclease
VLTTEIRIIVPGKPVGKGSLKCVARPGQPHRLVEDNAKAQPWRDTIAAAIRRSWPRDQHADPHQPLGAEVTITAKRPDGHLGTGRNAGVVKPAYVDTLPATRSSFDIDKLARLVLDAIQDTNVLPDDAQIVDLAVRKRFARPQDPVDDVLPCPGVVIRLYPIQEIP